MPDPMPQRKPYRAPAELDDLGPSMTMDQMKAVNFIEFFWNQHRKFPSEDEIRTRIPRFDLSEALFKATFKRGLTNRGVPIPEELPFGLTDLQMAGILLVGNMNDRRSIPAKLKSLNISMAKWNGWMKNPEFKNNLHRLVSGDFQDAVHIAQQALVKAVERGDVNAIKFYMELTGRSVDGASASTVNNLKMVITRLVEVIQFHVQDPETLRAIRADLAAVMDGKEPERKAIESWVL